MRNGRRKRRKRTPRSQLAQRGRDIHAARRAAERYGLVLSDRDLDEIAALCRKAKADGNADKVSTTRAIVDVEFRGKRLRAVYSKRNGGHVVTFLPPVEEAGD